MTRTRAGMTGGAKGMVERMNIGKDGEEAEREQWKGRRKAG